MNWSWQQPDWPNFSFADDSIAVMEADFLSESGKLLGAYKHLDSPGQETLRTGLLSDEALSTSAIEGELLDRASVQSSLQQNFDPKLDAQRSSGLREQGIAELLAETYRSFAEPLDDQTLHAWHAMVMRGQLDDTSLGRYRNSEQPMQIVSGDLFDPEIVFEAPPADQVPAEMKQFLTWFNITDPTRNGTPVPALTRAALSHLHFETIHPFSDGNGRIGRSIAEKALSQANGQPILIALSKAIEEERKGYYAALAATRHNNEVTGWVSYFAQAVLNAIADSLARIDYLIQKTHIFDRQRGKLNERQEKVLRRMFAEGPSGFRGGLSAANYISITKTSAATERRDLIGLVEFGALSKSGQKKGTRYALKLH